MLLPQPLGPTMVTNSCSSIARSMRLERRHRLRAVAVAHGDVAHLQARRRPSRYLGRYERSMYLATSKAAPMKPLDASASTIGWMCLRRQPAVAAHEVVLLGEEVAVDDRRRQLPLLGVDLHRLGAVVERPVDRAQVVLDVVAHGARVGLEELVVEDHEHVVGRAAVDVARRVQHLEVALGHRVLEERLEQRGGLHLVVAHHRRAGTAAAPRRWSGRAPD